MDCIFNLASLVMKETTLVLLQMKNGAISDSRLKSGVSLIVLEKCLHQWIGRWDKTEKIYIICVT